MSVAIIESGANYASIQVALNRLSVFSEVTADPEKIQNATHVILPGVGAARFAMQILKEKKLISIIRTLKQPVLGICLGQQLLCNHSQEDNTTCLGVIPIQVKRLTLKVLPNMGWNALDFKSDPLLKGIAREHDFYFVHSFAPEISEYTLAVTEDFSAIIKKDNFYGVQFHPEKSGNVGAKLLENFINL